MPRRAISLFSPVSDIHSTEYCSLHHVRPEQLQWDPLAAPIMWILVNQKNPLPVISNQSAAARISQKSQTVLFFFEFKLEWKYFSYLIITNVRNVYLSETIISGPGPVPAVCKQARCSPGTARLLATSVTRDGDWEDSGRGTQLRGPAAAHWRCGEWDAVKSENNPHLHHHTSHPRSCSKLSWTFRRDKISWDNSDTAPQNTWMRACKRWTLRTNLHCHRLQPGPDPCKTLHGSQSYCWGFKPPYYHCHFESDSYVI